MRVRYLQSSKCLIRCGPYYNPGIDLGSDELPRPVPREMEDYARRVLEAWKGSCDDEFHVATGVVFELEQVTCVYTFVNGEVHLAGGFFRKDV